MTPTLADVPKQLVAKPHVADLLQLFVDHYGMDSYHPCDDTIESVRQIVKIALADARNLTDAQSK